MFTKKKTFESAIASLNKVIEDLKQVKQERDATVGSLNQQILSLSLDRDAAAAEGGKAQTVQEKLEALLKP